MLINLIIMLVFATESINSIPINNSSLFHNGLHRSLHRSSPKSLHRSLAKRALSYIANDTVCIIDNLIYQNGDPIPTDDPCESCKCRPPGFACVLRECDVKPGCKEIAVEGECCPSYQCGCEHDGKFYKDGEFVPNPNKLLNCYSCKCRGSSIICGLMDCQFRFDCESRYRAGECCPNYDHCDIPSTSTQQTIFENQTNHQTSVKTSFDSTEKPADLKESSKITELFSSDQTTTTKKSTESLTHKNSIPESSSFNPVIINEQHTVTTPDTYSSVLPQLSSESSTISPLVGPSTQETTSKKVASENAPENDYINTETNNDISRDNESLTGNELNRVNSQSSSVVIGNNSLEKNDEKLSNQNATFNDDEIVSNINSQDKITQSPASLNEVTPLISNQVDQIDRRIDDFEINIKIVNSKVNDSISDEITDKIEIKANHDKTRDELNEKDEILDEISVQPTMRTDSIETNSVSQVTLTTIQSLIDINIPSSTTIPNITDTTILAPNTNSILNFTTQSSITKDELINRNNLDEMAKNDKSPLDTDDLNLSLELKESKTLSQEENEVKKMEEKLEKNPIEYESVSDNKIDETRTPLEMLKKVLENCKNGRCNSLDKLIRITEDTLKEFDTSIIEKVKLTNAFDEIKIKLISNSSTTMSPVQTDSPIEINSTDSGSIELDDNYPTTIKYVKTSDLVAEHRTIR